MSRMSPIDRHERATTPIEAFHHGTKVSVTSGSAPLKRPDGSPGVSALQ